MAPDSPKRTIRIFALASFLNDFGSDIIYPLWPTFVTTVLGANVAALGLIDGLGDAIVSISQAVSGYWSDRLRKRKVFIWAGYACGAFSRLGYAVVTVWPQAIVFRVLDRAGKMRGAPRDAMVAEVSTLENRGRNFGLLRTMDNLGAVCGIAVAILFFDWGYRTLFLLAALPTAIGVILVLAAIREHPGRATIFKGISLKHLDRNFYLFLAVSAIFALGSFSYSFLLLYAKQFGYHASQLPLLYLVFTAAAALGSLPFGKLADAIGRKQVMMLSFLFWGMTCLTMMMWESLAGAAAAFVLYGLHKGALEPVQKTLVAELAPAELKASTLGGFQMVIGLCALPSSLAAGLLWQNVSILAPLVVSMVLTAVALVMMMFVKDHTRSSENDNHA